jgi:hypothetical protein
MSVDISVSITEDIVDIIATPTVNIVNVTNSASIDPGLYDLSEFTNTSPNPFVRTSGLSSYVPTSRTLTINGTTQDLSADRTFTISTGITIGTTAITSGTVGRVLFDGTGNVVQESANLFWDNTNGRLGIGTSTPSAIIHSVGSVTASGAIARANFFNNTLVAAANNDALVGLDIQPTFTNGAFTGVENIPLRFVSQVNSTVVKSILLKNTGSGAGSGVSIGFNNINTNNLSNAFIKSYYVVPSGMAMSFGTGGGSSLTSEGTTALVLNADQTANFTARVIANSGGFQATGVSANLLMSDNGTPVITRNGSTGIQFLKDAYWQTFSIFTNNTENLRVASTGNVLINTTTDAGFRLDVNGTARVQDTLTVVKNQNLGTSLNITNTTSNFLASAVLTLTSDASSGNAQLGKYSTTTTAYKTLSPKDVWIYNSSTGGDISILNDFATGRIKFAAGASSTAQMTLAATGNVLINTTTDAGFRLDVNGTARVQNGLTLTNFTNITSGNNYFGFETFRTIFGTTANTISGQYAFNIDDGGGSSTLTSGTTGRFQLSSRFAPTSGTAVYNSFLLNATINQTGGANGITRGLYINPTLTSAADFRAIETTAGRVIFGGLPTSSAGLPTGAIWNDAGTLKIV